MYSWLQPNTDPSPLHNRAEALIEPHTCDWVQRTPAWTDWLEARARCLWIHGIPGAGKTVLLSHLIKELKKIHGSVIYYYCYFGHNQDEAAPFLRWLITQLCRQANSVPAELYVLFGEGCELSLPELLKILSICLDYFDKRIYVAVDAVDESKPRDNLLKVLRDLVTDHRFHKIQLLATSREYIDIEKVLDSISCQLAMSNPFIAADIRRYVASTLRKNDKFKRWPEQLLVETEEALATRAKGM